MDNKLTNLGHLRMEAERSQEQIAKVAEAAVIAVTELDATKQDKLTGTQGQVVGFNEDGSATPQDIAKVYKASFFGITGYGDFWNISLRADDTDIVSGSILFVPNYNSSILLGKTYKIRVVSDAPTNPNYTSSPYYPVYYKGSETISNDLVSIGDSVTFLFDGTAFHIIAVTRGIQDVGVTMEQVNTAIDEAITGAINASY